MTEFIAGIIIGMLIRSIFSSNRKYASSKEVNDLLKDMDDLEMKMRADTQRLKQRKL